jgi:hypothetical protein
VAAKTATACLMNISGCYSSKKPATRQAPQKTDAKHYRIKSFNAKTRRRQDVKKSKANPEFQA